VEALIVTDERKTLSGLYRQWVEAPDVSAVADFFRVSPWSGEEMGQGLSRFVMADMMQRAEAQGIEPIIYASIDDSLTSKDSRHDCPRSSGLVSRPSCQYEKQVNLQ
jgi:hypothetical protein